jgi:hypothetical protein
VWTLKGYLATHNNLFDQHLVINRVLPDGTVVEPGSDVPIDEAGYYETTLAEGTFQVTLADGNGGQPEVVTVVCTGYPAGTVYTDRPLLGHAATAADPPKQDDSDVVVILCALYGKIHFTTTPGYWSEWSTVNPHKFGQQTRTVVDVPAVGAYCDPDVTTQVPCTHIVPAVPAVYTTVHHDAVTHVVHHDAVYRQGAPCFSWTPGHVHGNKVSGNAGAPNRFVCGAFVYQETSSWTDPTFLVTGTYIAAYDETVVDQAAYDEQVLVTPAVPAHPEHAFDTQTTPGECHAAVPAVTHTEYRYYVMPVIHQDGHVVDVKGKVQAVVASGHRQFKFDNAQNPGGIFSTDNELLQQITDPAVGIVKSVHITYKRNGVTKVIHADEYDTINLNN